ncbi:hypothetical protein [Lentibacillus salinarum]|uniref:Uncharacterized protein n=1 Tax=Lentibacillus salinarum TaxID=446820 RepID=A0ABW3ZTC5_9BACI
MSKNKRYQLFNNLTYFTREKWNFSIIMIIEGTNFSVGQDEYNVPAGAEVMISLANEEEGIMAMISTWKMAIQQHLHLMNRVNIPSIAQFHAVMDITK